MSQHNQKGRCSVAGTYWLQETPNPRELTQSSAAGVLPGWSSPRTEAARSKHPGLLPGFHSRCCEWPAQQMRKVMLLRVAYGDKIVLYVFLGSLRVSTSEND